MIYVLRDDAMDLLAKLGDAKEETVLRMLAIALNVRRFRCMLLSLLEPTDAQSRAECR